MLGKCNFRLTDVTQNERIPAWKLIPKMGLELS